MTAQPLDQPILPIESYQISPRSVINLAQPNDVRGTFGSADDDFQPIRLDGKNMVFDSPYGDSNDSHGSPIRELCDSGSGGDNSGGRANSSGGTGTENIATSSGDQSTGVAGSDGSTGSAATPANLASLEQQIMVDLQQISQELQQLTTDLSQLLSGGVSQPAGANSDNSGSTQTSSSGLDNTGGTQTSGKSTDNIGGTQNSSTSTDNTGTQTSSTSTDNTGTQNSNTSTDNTGTQTSSTSTDNTGTQTSSTSTDNTGTQTSSTSTDNTGTQTSSTSTDNTGTQTSSTSTDNTGTQTSSTGTDNTGTQTSSTGTDNTGTQTSSTSTDNTGTQTSGAGTDNTGTQTSSTSTDNTGTQTSGAGYGSVSQYTPAAVIQQLQQSDPTLAKVVEDAQTAANQGQVSQAGFDLFAQNVGEAVANDGQSGIFQDDTTLLTTMASVGQSSADSAALTNVVNNDMKSLSDNNISTYGTGDPAAETGLAAPGTVADLIAQNDYGQRGIVTADAPFYGSTGWAYGTSNMDPPGSLTGTDNVTPWGVVYQGKGQTENPDANVEVSNSTTYYHLKTGGWVEAQAPSQNQWWEANYSANFQGGATQTNAQNQPNDTYQFAAPPAGDVDHFGPGNGSFNPSLYDGVYTTMNVKTDTPNSGLVMQLGDDAYGSFTGHDADPAWGNSSSHHLIGNNNFIELTTNWQPVYYTSLSQSEIENDPPPGLINANGSPTPAAVSG